MAESLGQREPASEWDRLNRHAGAFSTTAQSANTLNPLRSDHPTLRPSKRGKKDQAIAITATTESRERALAELEADVFARSSRFTKDSQWRTWCYFAHCWGIAPVPLTVDVIRKVLACFKAGGYRSVAGYIGRAIQMHIFRVGTPPCEEVQFSRSVSGGIGPSSLKDSFEVEALKDI